MCKNAETQERKQGYIQSWQGRWGIVFYTNKQSLFMHLTEFDANRTPLVGEQVTFEILPPFPGLVGKEGRDRLHRAVNVTPIETVDEIEGAL